MDRLLILRVFLYCQDFGLAQRFLEEVRCRCPLRIARMPSIRFAWNPLLVDLRREVCPGARWQKQGRCWIMNDGEAQRFVRAAQAGLDFQRSQARLRIDDITWVFGFARGAPYPLVSTSEKSKPAALVAPHP